MPPAPARCQVRDADPDQPGLAAPGHADPGHGALKVGEQTAPAVQQFRAGLGELDGAPCPREQPHLKEAFEPRDRLGQARLGNEQAGGCPPEMQLLGHHSEVPQIAELDPRGPVSRPGAWKAHDALPGRSGLCGGPRTGGHLAAAPSGSCILTCGDARGLSGTHRHLLE
jgi:hypothetical protein